MLAVVLQHSIFTSAHAGTRVSLAILGWSMWAVPLLFAASGYLSTLHRRPVDLPRRMRRLLVPYVGWSVVLFLYGAQGALRGGGSLAGMNWLGVVFAGEAFYTLWFLAMLVYVTCVGSVLRSDRARLVGAAVAILVYAGIAVVRLGSRVLGTDTWGGFLLIAPLCAGAYLAGALLPGAPPPRRRWIPLSLATAATGATATMYLTWGTELVQGQQFAILTTGAIAAFLTLWALRHVEAAGGAPGSTLLRGAAWAGTFTLGIYTIHAPVLNIVRRLTHTRDSASLSWALVLTVVATAVSLLASYAMSRVRALRPFVR